ncbi:hypothetical protein [Sphingomonas sp. 2SG]|uniref:hypothetical protein n=1 Tax=Sphingomonas sp. 2SG TaxID=2502201 RepID=UPI0010F91116|nr:hypothetical protein [Sphingomonas sp. 2SG]
MDEADFDAWADGLAHALAMSRKLQARCAPDAPVIHAVPSSSAGQQWRALIDRLNAIDPQGGWGRMKIGDVEFVAVRGTSEVPGASWF